MPDDFWFESKLEPSSDVTVWVRPSESQAQVTVVPAVTDSVAGLKRSFCTRTSPAGGGLLDVPPESLPHPNANSADATQSAGISLCGFISNPPVDRGGGSSAALKISRGTTTMPVLDRRRRFGRRER